MKEATVIISYLTTKVRHSDETTKLFGEYLEENKEQLTYEILSRTNNLDSVMAKYCSGKGNILPSLGTKCYVVT